jgi:3-dehydroquinate synthetase
MKKDKKAEGSFIHFVLPVEIGHVQIQNLSPEAVILALK